MIISQYDWLIFRGINHCVMMLYFIGRILKIDKLLYCDWYLFTLYNYPDSETQV